MMNTILSRVCAVLFGVMSMQSLFAATWETDYDKALERARAGAHAVLVDFTGSDWCHWCMVLREKVFETQEFSSYVKEQGLVLLELDFPRAQEKVPADQMAEREKIRERFNVTGFPTVMLLDAQGAPFARFAGSAVDPEEYIGRIQKALDVKSAFDAAVAAAREKEGEARAQALQDALKLLPPDCASRQQGIIDEIIANDPEDKTGCRAAAQEEKLLQEQRKMFADFLAVHRGPVTPEKVTAARLDAEKLLEREGLLPVTRQMIYKFISDCYAMERDLPHAHESLKAAVDAAPQTPEARKLRLWLENMERHMAEEKK